MPVALYLPTEAGGGYSNNGVRRAGGEGEGDSTGIESPSRAHAVRTRAMTLPCIGLYGYRWIHLAKYFGTSQGFKGSRGGGERARAPGKQRGGKGSVQLTKIFAAFPRASRASRSRLRSRSCGRDAARSTSCAPDLKLRLSAVSTFELIN